jgi:hypothetical protein
MLVPDAQKVLSGDEPPNRLDVVYFSVPIGVVTIVTLVLPVVATFVGVTDVGAGPSVVVANVRLPTRRSDVTDAPMPDVNPDGARRWSAVADCHSVISDVEPAIWTRPVMSRSITLEPTTVTLQLPVDCPFVRIKVLITGAVYVTCAARLSTCSPAVTPTARAAAVPTAVLHSTLLSDRHIVYEPPLPPTRTIALNGQWPAPLCPTIVTLTDPVSAAFVITTLLTDTPSIVTNDDRLPTSDEVLEVNCRADNKPGEALACTLLIDCQTVAATPLLPSRVVSLWRQWPAPEPTTVTLIAPVDAAFVGFELLTAGPSIVLTVTSEPSTTPTVPAREWPNETPPVSLPRSDVELHHRVFSITEPPTRDDHVLSRPSPVETIVTLVDPVAALFDGNIESKEYVLNVNGAESVESPTATVETTE